MEPVTVSLEPPLSEQQQLIVLFNQKRYTEAETIARNMVTVYANSAFSLKILGAILVSTQRHEEALPILLYANQLSPNDAECLNTLGSALQPLRRLDEALICFQRAVELNPNYALAYNNLGAALSDMGRTQESLPFYEKALTLSPESADFFSNQALALYHLGCPDTALNAFNRALIYAPRNAEILNKRGILLERLGRYREALESYEKALDIKPDMADALSNKGNVLKDQGLLLEADQCYSAALCIQPDLREAWHNRLFNMNYRSDIKRQEIFKAHLDFDQKIAAKVIPLSTIKNWNRDLNRRLRLGFVSGDFRQHSVAFFIHPILKRLNREKFELFFYMTCHDHDEMTRTFQLLADHWIDAFRFGARALANQIRSDCIDILFDLSGHTESNALLAFAAKPAPIQITWIGYPNTTGLSAMDYRLVDAITDPVGQADAYHTERLIRLPHGFLCYRPLDTSYVLATGQPPFLKHGFVHFGSFNTLAKLTTITLNLWSEILHAVPKSRLVLKTPRTADTCIWERIILEFQQRGIESERLVLLGRAASQSEHLTLYQHIDIALDSYPYNGTTTTCEALFMGVPVITLAGDRHAARVGASLLTQVGLSELVAYSPLEYVQLAVKLATNQKQLVQWRTKLRDQLQRSVLCDEIGFTYTLENILHQIWHAWCIGEIPQILKTHQTDTSSTISIEIEQQIIVEYFEKGKLDAAQNAARKMIEHYPNASFGWKALGTVLAKSHINHEAVTVLQRAIQLSPLDAELLETLGRVWLALNSLDAAEDCLQSALTLQPKNAAVQNTLGAVFSAQGRLTQAVDKYEQSLALHPKNTAQVYSNLANQLKELGRIDEALAAYAQALEIEPHAAAIQSNQLLCLNYHSGLTREKIFNEHLKFQKQQASQIQLLPTRQSQCSNLQRPLRLGLVSADFRYHSVAFFIAPIIEHLDREKFELICYSKSHQDDAITASFERLSTVWRSCAMLSDTDLANLIYNDRIDILIDLNGHTRGNALLAFAARPAPVQASWIGYPNTTGLSAIDYRLVDNLTDPIGDADFYHTEHLVRLPNSFLCYRPSLEAFALPVSPSPFLSREQQITFGSFNAIGKISLVTLELWSAVLRAVRESRLLLKSSLAADNDSWQHIVTYFIGQGIKSDRLKILPCSASHVAHLEQYREIDIALDTYPYNGTTTTCEALFMGVPVITLAGDRHAARVGKSLLTQVGLTDLIANSSEHYVQIATYWANNRRELNNLRAGLRERLEHSPLCDEVVFTRNLEAALQQMWNLLCLDIAIDSNTKL